MKKTVVITEEAENFANLNPQMQRMMILSNGVFKYTKTFEVISDINGKGWFAGQYSRRPYMSKNGNIYYKTNCHSSITYKNGKIWGNMSQSVLLRMLATNVSQFEFLKDCEFITSNRITLPEHVVKSILSGKITSQEDVWKAVAKKSYKNKHWKIVRFCKQNYIPIMLLELGCRDWEAILDIKYEIPYTFNSLLRAACIVGEKVSCKWSERRMEEEYKRLSRSLKLIELESKDNTPVYDLSNIIDIGYTIVNTEITVAIGIELKITNILLFIMIHIVLAIKLSMVEKICCLIKYIQYIMVLLQQILCKTLIKLLNLYCMK